MENKRQGMIVYLHSLKQSKMLKIRECPLCLKTFKIRCAVLQYESARKNDGQDILLLFCEKVEPSYKPFLKLEFESKLDKAKEYDYKIGI